ncbi:MAG: hypothetical protein JOZ15_18325 [Acidobacteria bacterium]|nr:hypothetical protein [Acidobacteriota bacterium]
MSSDSIDYQRFVEDALRDAVRRLLAEVAEQGLPGGHHFYIGFHTAHPGVVMPRSLRDLYPKEMNLILQHQFWNLEVDAAGFAVELSFSGSRQRLAVPFAALTLFADPSAEFALRFTPKLPGPAEVPGGVTTTAKPAAAAAASPQPAAGAGATAADGAAGPRPAPGEVIRFDPSRRK